ncbi:MAG: TlpA family protein disulfide reductase [Ruminococcaceae bacterium]|nr:TlpA family protein disulfide reductase [Oscillospiraceae bacterium]
MKKYIKLIISAVILVALIAGAVVLYNRLSEDYEENQGMDGASESGTPVETEEPEETDESEIPDETDEVAGDPVLELPDSTFYDMDGNAVNLSDFLGKPMIVNFWATWCGPCKSEMPHFQEMYEEYGDRVEFIMINATDGYRDTVESVGSFMEDNGYTFPVYCDSDFDAINTYGVYAFPSTIVINADGSVYGTKVGALSKNQLQGYINALLGIN